MTTPTEATGLHGTVAATTGGPPWPGAGPDDQAARPARPRAWAWWFLRVWCTLQAVDAFLQPVFEGRFLSGDFSMLQAHSTNGIIVGAVSITQVAVAVVAWRVSRLPGRVVAAFAAIGVAVPVQIALGFSRNLGIHIPLGVAIIAISARLAAWMWTHRPGDVRAPGRPASPKGTP